MFSMCEKLVYGKMCVHGHVNENGLCLRFKVGGGCCRCFSASFKDLMDEEIELYYITKSKAHGVKELTPEQRRRRSEASMRWTKKNKDKHKVYQEKYYSKPETKEKERIKHKTWYDSLTPEQKQEVLASHKAWRDGMTEEQKARKRAKDLERYHARPKKPRKPKIVKEKIVKSKEETNAHTLMMHEKRKEEARARYALLTIEEKRELAALNKARIAAKKQREQDDRSKP